jgi:hypothetical protein
MRVYNTKQDTHYTMWSMIDKINNILRDRIMIKVSIETYQ